MILLFWFLCMILIKLRNPNPDPRSGRVGLRNLYHISTQNQKAIFANNFTSKRYCIIWYIFICSQLLSIFQMEFCAWISSHFAVHITRFERAKRAVWPGWRAWLTGSPDSPGWLTGWLTGCLCCLVCCVAWLRYVYMVTISKNECAIHKKDNICTKGVISARNILYQC